MKRNRIIALLAVTSVALFALPAFGKIAPSEEKPAAAQTEATGKYSVLVGYGYTSLNQVNNSRYGLQGVDVVLSRDFGRYFALVTDGAYYKWSLIPCDASKANSNCNPGDPSVWQAMAGPELHAELYGRTSVFVHGLLGVAHTGGENMNPATSLAGGFGLGVQYKLKSKLAIRISGDDIMASFSLRNNSPSNAYSPHRTSNSRVTMGVVYRF